MIEPLRGQLSAEEARAAYCFLRDNCCRWESEWRDDFIRLLGIAEEDLPRSDPAGAWSATLHGLIERGEEAEAEQFCRQIGVPTWIFPPDQNCPEPSFVIYPIDEPDENGETPIAKAQRTGLHQIARFLLAQKTRIERQYAEDWKASFGDGSPS